MAYWIIVIAVLTRFIPHLPNFSPVYGALLFGGANLKKRDSIWFGTLLLGASDIVLTNFMYHLNIGWGELIQMAAFASVAMTGWILRKRVTIPRFTAACLIAPLAFYVISDFGVWVGFHTYPPTFAGLVACYVAAIPFQGRITASTVLFAGILFGTQQLYVSRENRKVHALPN